MQPSKRSSHGGISGQTSGWNSLRDTHVSQAFCNIMLSSDCIAWGQWCESAKLSDMEDDFGGIGNWTFSMVLPNAWIWDFRSNSRISWGRKVSLNEIHGRNKYAKECRICAPFPYERYFSTCNIIDTHNFSSCSFFSMNLPILHGWPLQKTREQTKHPCPCRLSQARFIAVLYRSLAAQFSRISPIE